MPEFVMAVKTAAARRRYEALDEFTRGFVEGMFWADTGAAEDGELAEASFDDLSPEAVAKIGEDCASFQSAGEPALEGARRISASCTARSAGVDFYCTRNGYGTGFWDGSWPPPFGESLTRLAQKYHGLHPVRGGDDLIYIERS